MNGERTEGVSDETSAHRGQTAVLGFVFVVALVVVASVGLIVVADRTTGEIEQRAEKERVEGALVELGSELETASSAADAARAMELTLTDHREDLRFERSGAISITVDDETVYDESLGSIEYVANDGTRIVYQAGGVWRDDGSGFYTVSEPNVYVRDGTVSVPVTVLDGADGLDDGQLELNARQRQSLHSSTVETDVIINVTTAYHEWWETYFRTHLGDDAVSVTDTGASAEETVSVSVDGRADRAADFVVERGITVEDRFDSSGGVSGPTVHSDIVASEIHCGENSGRYDGNSSTVSCENRLDEGGGYEARLDDTGWLERVDVDSLVASMANESGTDLGSVELREEDESMTLTAGHYHADEVKLDNDLIVDLSAGDVSLVVGEGGFRGSNPDYADGIVVQNATDGHAFRVYNTGDLHMTGQWEVCAMGCDGTNTSAVEYYAHSGTDVRIASERTVFEGIVVAPDSTVRLDGADFSGALVAENVVMRSPRTTFRYDDELDGTRFLFEDDATDDRDVQYLNVVVTEISVRNE